ncbi:uncharacterized protein PAC_18362 [Phialocephala subalpina]|uniref:Uncharacterized protein n=1 Tax=Phialocephala subalpina TaxID=576137 RepID=A0A1L7XTU3_9HELO|nr:uncharacterized protein PAC_18362 [Phialocephala subalpina]
MAMSLFKDFDDVQDEDQMLTAYPFDTSQVLYLAPGTDLWALIDEKNKLCNSPDAKYLIDREWHEELATQLSSVGKPYIHLDDLYHIFSNIQTSEYEEEKKLLAAYILPYIPLDLMDVSSESTGLKRARAESFTSSSKKSKITRSEGQNDMVSEAIHRAHSTNEPARTIYLASGPIRSIISSQNTLRGPEDKGMIESTSSVEGSDGPEKQHGQQMGPHTSKNATHPSSSGTATRPPPMHINARIASKDVSNFDDDDDDDDGLFVPNQGDSDVVHRSPNKPDILINVDGMQHGVSGAKNVAEPAIDIGEMEKEPVYLPGSLLAFLDSNLDLRKFYTGITSSHHADLHGRDKSIRIVKVESDHRSKVRNSLEAMSQIQEENKEAFSSRTICKAQRLASKLVIAFGDEMLQANGEPTRKELQSARNQGGYTRYLTTDVGTGILLAVPYESFRLKASSTSLSYLGLDEAHLLQLILSRSEYVHLLKDMLALTEPYLYGVALGRTEDIIKCVNVLRVVQTQSLSGIIVEKETLSRFGAAMSNLFAKFDKKSPLTISNAHGAITFTKMDAITMNLDEKLSMAMFDAIVISAGGNKKCNYILATDIARNTVDISRKQDEDFCFGLDLEREHGWIPVYVDVQGSKIYATSISPTDASEEVDAITKALKSFHGLAKLDYILKWGVFVKGSCVGGLSHRSVCAAHTCQAIVLGEEAHAMRNADDITKLREMIPICMAREVEASGVNTKQ